MSLATTLYTYSNSAFKADKSLQRIATDISLTSSALSELSNLLGEDSTDRLVSDSALKTAEQTVASCKEVFEEINDAVVKMIPGSRPVGQQRDMLKCLDASTSQRDGSGMGLWSRLKWPIKEPSMRLLQAHLDRLKSTLLLMLHVITYGRKLFSE
jgi:hypothetical protein